MDRKARDDAIERMTRGLYETMPGAEQPGHVDVGGGHHVKAWGDVEHTQHYQFCRSIALAVVMTSGTTFILPD